MVVCSHGAVSPGLETPRQTEAATAAQLTFLAAPSRPSAAVTLGEFLDTTCRVDEFLLAGEKRMAGRTNTDSKIASSRAGMIHRTARTNHVGLLIFRVNACFHSSKMSAECNRAEAFRKQ